MGDAFWTAALGGGYTSNFAGTSFSAPIVSAAVAFCWTARPALKVWDLWNIFTNTALMQTTTGFTAYPAGCLDLDAVYVSSLTYRQTSGGGATPLMRR